MKNRVALRKESVDRNRVCGRSWLFGLVALRKESVDRNLFLHPLGQATVASLSARRAWIEISCAGGAESEKGRRSPQGERG